MKIIVLQENLKVALTHVRRVIPSKPQLPILASILFEADDSGIFISGTDLYTGMKVRLKGSVETTGSVAIPASVLFETVNTLLPGKVMIESVEGKTKVETDQTKASIQSFVSDDFPPFPAKEGDELSLNWSAFDQLMSVVPMATAKDDARPILTSLLFDFSTTDTGVSVVGTDGFRLAIQQIADDQFSLADKAVPDHAQLLIPAKALQEVHRVASREKSKSEIKLTFSEPLKQVFFGVEDIEMVIRLMDGEFPPYQKILPESFQTELEIDAELLESQIKGALVFAKEASQIVMFEFTENQLHLKATSPTLGSHHSQLPCSVVRGAPKPIAFNAQYVLEMLQATKSKNVVFRMNQSLQPAEFSSSDQPGFRYIVMPFRVSDV